MVLVSGDALLLLTTEESKLPASSLLPGASGPQATQVLDISGNTVESSEKYSVYITEEDLVQNKFIEGERFFYYLYEGSRYEFGLAEVVASGTRFLLDRKNINLFFDGEVKNFTNRPHSFTGPKLFLQVSSPEDIQSTLFFPNSIPCVSASGAYSSVTLDNNTILGCINNEVQAINNSEFSENFREGVISAVYEQDLNLHSVRLIPTTRPINPPRGTIIYNNQYNHMEFYNGIQWVTL